MVDQAIHLSITDCIWIFWVSFLGYCNLWIECIHEYMPLYVYSLYTCMYQYKCLDVYLCALVQWILVAGKLFFFFFLFFKHILSLVIRQYYKTVHLLPYTTHCSKLGAKPSNHQIINYTSIKTFFENLCSSFVNSTIIRY